MAGKLPIRQKELIRAKALEQVVQKKMSIQAAAVMMKVSYRQAKRIFRQYGENENQLLLHLDLRRPSGRASAETLRARVVELYNRSGIGTLGRPLRQRSCEPCMGLR